MFPNLNYLHSKDEAFTYIYIYIYIYVCICVKYKHLWHFKILESNTYYEAKIFIPKPYMYYTQKY